MVSSLREQVARSTVGLSLQTNLAGFIIISLLAIYVCLCISVRWQQLFGVPNPATSLAVPQLQLVLYLSLSLMVVSRCRLSVVVSFPSCSLHSVVGFL